MHSHIFGAQEEDGFQTPKIASIHISFAKILALRDIELDSTIDDPIQDEDAFFEDYAQAHMKLSELGWVPHLMFDVEYYKF